MWARFTKSPKGWLQYSKAGDSWEPLPPQAKAGKGESSYWNSAPEKTGEIYLIGAIIFGRGTQPTHRDPIGSGYHRNKNL